MVWGCAFVCWRETSEIVAKATPLLMEAVKSELGPCSPVISISLFLKKAWLVQIYALSLSLSDSLQGLDFVPWQPSPPVFAGAVFSPVIYQLPAPRANSQCRHPRSLYNRKCVPLISMAET